MTTAAVMSSFHKIPPLIELAQIEHDPDSISTEG